MPGNPGRKMRSPSRNFPFRSRLAREFPFPGFLNSQRLIEF